jgi:hypothetical protein
MAIPILQNHTEYIRGLREETPLEAVIRRIPATIELTEGNLDGVAARLRDLRARYDREGLRAIESDGEVARLVHDQLRLDSRTGAEKPFWALLSAVKAPDFVQWRWGKADGGPAPANRYNGGWKDTFRRLWYRAELAKGAHPDDPYFYVDHGGEDFWVGIIEREFSQCRSLLHTFLEWWLGPDGERQRSMEEHRRFFIALRLLRPYRAYEALRREDQIDLFREAERLAHARWVEELKV